MNLFSLPLDKKKILKELPKKKNWREVVSSKDETYIEINASSFDLSFKCLNENYKRKNSSRA